MAGTTVVTPDLLRSTKQKIESRLQEAATIAQQYLSGHENILSAGWKGDAGTTSLSTAGEVEHDLQQIMTGGQRLAHGLGSDRDPHGAPRKRFVAQPFQPVRHVRRSPVHVGRVVQRRPSRDLFNVRNN